MATTGTSNNSGKSKSTTRSAAAKKAAETRARDAVAMLKADHRKVEDLFKQFEKTEQAAKRKDIVGQIIMELRVHMTIEEEIFYPESREFVAEELTVNEAIVEHEGAKNLMMELEGMDPSDEMYEAKVTVLQEMIEHHVEEEEKEYFPEAQKNGMPTKEIGERMMARKEELMGEMDGPERTH
ncbi:hemerythrin domain-containing protein [Phenylobacterium sp. J367]|uniref:hemerythrin domain-containing protein n=1 Tax=Phenylobacterium sp. J367 TaxID=2898435 RepID=UPI002151475F|nr:hemerythrin domain-containing protein [Phenylobacterium sp. J367]MCR5880845.1 hemerythrin domain-containing protein [Phenylobacterium sp. J367]